MDELLNAATAQGIWALLSCTLIVYILKKQESRDHMQDEREQKYQDIIETLTSKLSILDSLNTSIQEIKDELKKEFKKQVYIPYIISLYISVKQIDQ